MAFIRSVHERRAGSSLFGLLNNKMPYYAVPGTHSNEWPNIVRQTVLSSGNGNCHPLINGLDRRTDRQTHIHTHIHFPPTHTIRRFVVNVLTFWRRLQTKDDRISNSILHSLSSKWNYLSGRKGQKIKNKLPVPSKVPGTGTSRSNHPFSSFKKSLFSPHFMQGKTQVAVIFREREMGSLSGLSIPSTLRLFYANNAHCALLA